jgi:adenylate cyclase
MGLEIERKFLIKNDAWKTAADNGTKIEQGYLNSNKERTVRVRIYGDAGFLTVKGKNNKLTRQEFEYNIPLVDAQELLKLCEKPLIEKTRYLIKENNHSWEIDIFEGENKGLEIAEIEIEKEKEEINYPDWLGKEVSNESKYYNSSLILRPYCKW